MIDEATTPPTGIPYGKDIYPDDTVYKKPQDGSNHFQLKYETETVCKEKLGKDTYYTVEIDIYCDKSIEG